MSRLVDKIFEKLTMNLENSNFELTEKGVRLHKESSKIAVIERRETNQRQKCCA
jgi:predicted transcriptional regulator